jgi:hypothetical protein
LSLGGQRLGILPGLEIITDNLSSEIALACITIRHQGVHTRRWKGWRVVTPAACTRLPSATSLALLVDAVRLSENLGPTRPLVPQLAKSCWREGYALVLPSGDGRSSEMVTLANFSVRAARRHMGINVVPRFLCSKTLHFAAPGIPATLTRYPSPVLTPSVPHTVHLHVDSLLHTSGSP